jgi:hypothetical protein
MDKELFKKLRERISKFDRYQLKLVIVMLRHRMDKESILLCKQARTRYKKLLEESMV